MKNDLHYDILITDYAEQIENGRLFVKSILKPYEGCGNIRILRDVLSIEDETKNNVILRHNVTEEFWREVISAAEKFRVCALGTSGIGKTTSTCILIRLLLENKHIVLYHVRSYAKDEFVYMFTFLESTGEIDVQVVPEDQFRHMKPEFNNPSIYYVVDPGDTFDRCNPPVKYKGKVIIVTSPDDRHWGGTTFRKKRRVSGTFRYYPVWEIHELLSARIFFESTLSEEDIIDRFEQVGGIPRNIFCSKDEFLDILEDQALAINDLTNEQVQRLTLDNVNSAQTLGSGQPKSAIMVYKSPQRNFKDVTVSVASRRVARILVEMKMNFLWNVIIEKGGSRGSTSWLSFEIYCHNLMTSGDVRSFFDYKYHDGASLCLATNNRGLPLQLGNCTNIKQTTESLIVAAMQKDSENVIFHSTNTQYPLIDFLYRRGNILYAFQVSIGNTHSCKSDDLKDAIEEAGSEYAFLLHYLTFDEKYDEYELAPANPFLNDNTISIRNSQANDWTIKVIRVPSPYEEHLGLSQKYDRNLLPINEVTEILKNEPALLN